MNIETVIRIVNQVMKSWKNRILLMVGRGIIMAIKDDGPIQLAQVTLLADEVKDKTEVMGHFGFTSGAPVGSDAIMLSVGSNRDHGVIIATESREFRFKGIALGDSAMYNKSGKYLHLKGNNLEALVSKLKISNDENELISVLSDFMDGVISGKVTTAIGPQPFTPDTVTALTEIKEKLDTFKE